MHVLNIGRGWRYKWAYAQSICARVRTYVRNVSVYLYMIIIYIRDLDRKYSYSNSTSQRGKMASQADLLQEAERLIEKKDINAAIDLLNRLGTKFSAGVIFLYKRS